MPTRQRAHPMPPDPGHIASVRHFGRWYSKRLGFLEETLLGSGHSLPEARMLYEIRFRGTDSAKQLGRDLRLDPGHVSRVLRRLEERGLIRRVPSSDDARRRVIELTVAGRRECDRLDRCASDQIASLLDPVSRQQRHRLVSAMKAIEATLAPGPDSTAPIVLRGHRLGDLGWVVSRHGVIYGQEYGWDETFEGLVASLAGQFLERFDPQRERSWIAEIDGERVGSIFATRRSDTTAQLRMLLLEAKARGRGLGRRLVEECVVFARSCGYRDMMLETVSILTAARKIYQSVGFEITASEPKHTWGHDLVHERWELAL